MPAKKRIQRVTPAKRKSAPARGRSAARAASASAPAKPSKAVRSSAVSAPTKPRRSFDTRVIGIGVVCVLIVMTLGAARRHPPTEAEIAKIIDSALKDPNAQVVSLPDEDTELTVAEPVRTPAPSRVKPAAQPPALAPTQPLRAAAMTTASTRPEMVAPVVMGAIGRQQQENGLDPQGLSQYLGEQQQQVQAADPGLMGTLNSMLDSNRDGSVADDLSRIAGNFFK